jgi:putative transcriptional regulator
MIQLLRNINVLTKFQILVEVARNQPDVQQRDIAKRLGISPQAVSDYVKEIVQDGWLSSEGRSKYRVTIDGVDWMLKRLKEWEDYSDSVQKAVAFMLVSPAMAGCDVSKGQTVGLVMRDGLLQAVDDLSTEAKGVAFSDAGKGEDVGVSNFEGILPIDMRRIVVIRVPAIQKGGSRSADLGKLKETVSGRHLIGAVGLEAIVALRKVGVEPSCVYGVKEAVVQAQRSGLSVAVACVDSDLPDLVKALEEAEAEHEILEGRMTSS